jgi:hypothetical protein
VVGVVLDAGVVVGVLGVVVDVVGGVVGAVVGGVGVVVVVVDDVDVVVEHGAVDVVLDDVEVDDALVGEHRRVVGVVLDVLLVLDEPVALGSVTNEAGCTPPPSVSPPPMSSPWPSDGASPPSDGSAAAWATVCSSDRWREPDASSVVARSCGSATTVGPSLPPSAAPFPRVTTARTTAPRTSGATISNTFRRGPN